MRFFRLLYLLSKTFIVYLWRYHLSKIGVKRAAITVLAIVIVYFWYLGYTAEDQMDRDFKGAKAQICTFWTTTYPMHQFTIYAVEKGEIQYLRMNHSISGAAGRQAEYILVKSGMTYVWTTWSKPPTTGVKFPNAPVPFREFFGIDSIKHKDFRCDNWKPGKGEFFPPGNITFKAVTASEFVRDETYTPVLKAYIRKNMR